MNALGGFLCQIIWSGKKIFIFTVPEKAWMADLAKKLRVQKHIAVASVPAQFFNQATGQKLAHTFIKLRFGYGNTLFFARF